MSLAFLPLLLHNTGLSPHFAYCLSHRRSTIVSPCLFVFLYSPFRRRKLILIPLADDAQKAFRLINFLEAKWICDSVQRLFKRRAGLSRNSYLMGNLVRQQLCVCSPESTPHYARHFLPSEIVSLELYRRLQWNIRKIAFTPVCSSN